MSLETTDEDLSNFILLPLDDRLVVRRDDSEKLYKGLIIIPDKGQQSKCIGTILHAGPGQAHLGPDGEVEYSPMFLKEGDRIIFGIYAGTDIRWGTEMVTVITVRDVIAKIERKP